MSRIDYGFNAVESILLDQSDLTATMSGIAALKATRVRVLAGWTQIETARGVYSWTAMDAVMATAAQYKLKPLVLITPFGGWSMMPTWGPTQSDFGDFCAAVAQRYGVTQGISTEYEIWDEPNNIGNLNPPSAAFYVEWLKNAYTAIKSVQPTSTVLTGGLEANATDIYFPFAGDTIDPYVFLQGIYAAGGQDYFDAVANHPYALDDAFNYIAPTLTAPFIADDVLIRSYMNSQGDTAKPLWWTEFGFPTASMTQTQQTTWLQEQFGLWQSLLPNRGPCFFYNFRDTTTNASDPLNTLGIVDYQYNPKPAYYWCQTINPSIYAQFAGTGSMATLQTNLPTLAGAGALTATISTIQHVTAAFTGDSDLDIEFFGRPAAPLGGAGALTAALAPSLPAPLTGSGSLYCIAQSIPLLTAAFSGVGAVQSTTMQERIYTYTFTGTGSTVPTSLFTSFGLGYTVSGGVANNASTSTTGTYYSGAIYDYDQLSADHSASVTLPTGAINLASGDRSPIAIVRSDPAGNNWVGCTGHWGGANSIQILTCIGGVVTSQMSGTGTIDNDGDVMQLVAQGNTYTVYKNGVSTGVVWSDLSGIFPEPTNTRTGFGFQYIYANGLWGTAGIASWTGSDLAPSVINPKIAASFGGAGVLAASALIDLTASFTGSGSLVCGAQATLSVAAGFTGSGALSVFHGFYANANFAGSGALSAALEAALSAALSGSGALAAALAPLLSASFTGSGALAASDTAMLAAGFTGSGQYAATFAQATIAANFTGSGSLSSAPTQLGAVYQASAQGTPLGGNPVSWTHNCPTSDESTWVIAFGALSGSGITSYSMTYGGTAMTLIGSQGGGSSGGLAVYAMQNPPTGNQSVVWTANASSGLTRVGSSVSFTTVGNVSGFTSATSTSTTPTVTVASESDYSLAVGGMYGMNTTVTETGTNYGQGTLGIPVVEGSTSNVLSGTIASGKWLAAGVSLDPPWLEWPSFTGFGSLSATVQPVCSATLAGSGSLTAQISIPASFSGSGSLTSTIKPNEAAALSGSGTLSATVSVVGAAGFTGSGALSATIGLGANFTGSGALTATITAGPVHDNDGSGGTTLIGNSASGSCTGTQVVGSGSNPYMLVWVAVNTSGGWINSFSTLTVTSSLGGTFTDISDVWMALSGQSTQSIHLFVCTSPASGTHTLTASVNTGSPWIGGNITIASVSYVGVAHGYQNLTTQGGGSNSTAALSISQSSATGHRAVVGLVDGNTGYGSTFNQTLRSNIASGASYQQYIQIGDAAGASTVSFASTTNSTMVGAISVDLY